MSAKDLVIAIDRDDADELAIVLSFTNEGINDMYDGGTPLWHAINKYTINVDIVERLLEAGANPDLGGISHRWETPIQFLLSRREYELAKSLVRYGANLSVLNIGEKHTFLWGESRKERRALGHSLNFESYLESRYIHYGCENPEDLTDDYKVAAVRSGYSAFTILDYFGEGFGDSYYDPNGERGWRRLIFSKNFAQQVRAKQMRKNQPGGPIWCACRMGQTMTILEDGRAVLIAGEHEDGNDPEFCIYNDVIVINPDGQIEIYGYPSEVFPPTDFHTATRVGEWIYIIGSLGYQGTQPDEVSVYRLSLLDFHIEKCPTTGDVPPQMCRHSAKLIDGHNIRTWGGKWSKPYSDRPEDHFHELDLNSMEWRRIDSASKE